MIIIVASTWMFIYDVKKSARTRIKQNFNFTQSIKGFILVLGRWLLFSRRENLRVPLRVNSTVVSKTCGSFVVPVT